VAAKATAQAMDFLKYEWDDLAFDAGPAQENE
jgi:hypothetical protein